MPQDPCVQFVDIDDQNWREVVDITPRADQERFVAPVARYLLLAHYGGEWNPLGIQVDGETIGHVMWATDDDEGSVWMGGLVIDQTTQGRGIGRAAVKAFIDRFTCDAEGHIALSYDPENGAARSLYASLGFVETGEMEGDEIVARYRRG